MTVSQLLGNLNSKEISEWMAFDMTNNPEWIKDYNKQLELEQSKALSAETKLAAFKRMFSGSRDSGGTKTEG